MIRRFSRVAENIKGHISYLDRCNSIRSNKRRAKLLLEYWNQIFKNYIENTDDEYEKSVAYAYFGMLSYRQSQWLDWDDFKKLTLSIIKQIQNTKKEDWT